MLLFVFALPRTMKMGMEDWDRNVDLITGSPDTDSDSQKSLLWFSFIFPFRFMYPCPNAGLWRWWIGTGSWSHD